MKTTQHIMSFGLLMMLISCGQPNENKLTTVVSADTLQTSLDKREQERLEKKRKIEEQDFEDSLRLDKVLQDVLKTANENINNDRFIKNYEVITDSIPVSVEINLNYHFTKDSPHLLIRRNEPSVIYFDVFSKVDNRFEKVISHKQWNMTYVNDTIKDINGDGLNDFIVNWYGASGCCLKAFSDVYLFKPNKNGFSRNFEFINPTFSPEEGIIRGVQYGHPGNTDIYKYRWNGLYVDTLEYISLEKDNDGNNTGRIIRSKKRSHFEKDQKKEALNNLPKEYRNIYGIEWFLGKM